MVGSRGGPRAIYLGRHWFRGGGALRRAPAPSSGCAWRAEHTGESYGPARPVADEHVAGPEVRRPAAHQGTQLHDHGAAHARDLHRRQHRDLQHRAIGRAQAAACAARRPHRVVPQQLSERRRDPRNGGRPRLLRSPRADGHLRGTRAVPPAGRDARRQGRRGTAVHDSRDALVLPAGLGHAGPRPHLHGKRGRRGQGPGGHPQPWRLAARIRRRPRRRRQDDAVERQTVSDRRRHAGRLHVPVERHRRLPARFVHRQGTV